MEWVKIQIIECQRIINDVTLERVWEMKKSKEIITMGLILLLPCLLVSQEKFGESAKGNKKEVRPEKQEVPLIRNKFDLGCGTGLDYGGVLGLKLTYAPIKHLGVFGSFGYHHVAVGWQIGVTGYILPKIPQKKVRPYIKLFYGTNRVIQVEGGSDREGNYVGFTTGAGCEMRFGSTKKHGLDLDLNYMITSAGFQEDYDYFKNSPYYDISDPPVLAFSIGYHYEF
jgi:hypothetical protein